MKDNDTKLSREGSEKNDSHGWHWTWGCLTSQEPRWSNGLSRGDGERESWLRTIQAQLALPFVNIKCPWKLASF